MLKNTFSSTLTRWIVLNYWMVIRFSCFGTILPGLPNFPCFRSLRIVHCASSVPAPWSRLGIILELCCMLTKCRWYRDDWKCLVSCVLSIVIDKVEGMQNAPSVPGEILVSIYESLLIGHWLPKLYLNNHWLFNHVINNIRLFILLKRWISCLGNQKLNFWKHKEMSLYVFPVCLDVAKMQFQAHYTPFKDHTGFLFRVDGRTFIPACFIDF